MSTDVDCVGTAAGSFHEIWGAVACVGVGGYVLSIFLGGAAFLVLIPVCSKLKEEESLETMQKTDQSPSNNLFVNSPIYKDKACKETVE